MNEKDLFKQEYLDKWIMPEQEKVEPQYRNELLEQLEEWHNTDPHVRAVIKLMQHKYWKDYKSCGVARYFKYGFIQYMMEFRNGEFMLSIVRILKLKADEATKALETEIIMSKRPIIIQGAENIKLTFGLTEAEK